MSSSYRLCSAKADLNVKYQAQCIVQMLHSRDQMESISDHSDQVCTFRIDFFYIQCDVMGISIVKLV